MDEKKFPNGFRSWMETFYEVVTHVERNKATSSKVEELLEQEGFPALYDLAEQLTDSFELQNKDRFWDGEFLEDVENFVNLALRD